MSVIQAHLIGRFGNQLFQYAVARAQADKTGSTLETPYWVGERIFKISDRRIGDQLPPHSDLALEPSTTDVCLRGCGQNQKCMIYTAEKARSWFQLRDEWLEPLEDLRPPDDHVVAHRRVGDYPGYGYPVVSEKSYLDACKAFDLPEPRFVSEEFPIHDQRFAQWAPWMPDFYRLMKSPVLLRGNSTFSWWAAVLGGNRVFSPIIEGLKGGREHDVEFVEGNWPRFCNLDFVTDLHMP